MLLWRLWLLWLLLCRFCVVLLSKSPRMDVLLHSASGYHRKVMLQLNAGEFRLLLLAEAPPRKFCSSVFAIQYYLSWGWKVRALHCKARKIAESGNKNHRNTRHNLQRNSTSTRLIDTHTQNRKRNKKATQWLTLNRTEQQLRQTAGKQTQIIISSSQTFCLSLCLRLLNCLQACGGNKKQNTSWKKLPSLPRSKLARRACSSFAPCSRRIWRGRLLRGTVHTGCISHFVDLRAWLSPTYSRPSG